MYSKTIFLTLTLTLFMFSWTNAQRKIYTDQGTNKKVKGVITLLEPVVEEISVPAIGLGASLAFSAAPGLIDFGADYIVNSIKNNVALYEAKYEALNALNFTFGQEKRKQKFLVNNYYYEPGDQTGQPRSFGYFEFSLVPDEAGVNFILELSNYDIQYTQAKIKKKYNFVLYTFELEVFALTGEQDKRTTKAKSLGTTFLKVPVPQTGQMGETLLRIQSASYPLFDQTQYTITCKVSELNPYKVNAERRSNTLEDSAKNLADFLQDLNDTLQERAEEAAENKD